MSRWVEAKVTSTNDSKVVMDFIKTHIFSQFGTPKAHISDFGTNLCNQTLEFIIKKYGVEDKVSTTYHP